MPQTGESKLRLQSTDPGARRRLLAFPRPVHERAVHPPAEQRNKKDAAVDVRVSERLWRWSNWEVLEKSHEFARLDAASIEFRVSVPSNGETVVTYRVKNWWP